MLLLVLAFAGGALTILSPCILPVLPLVFARADRPFAKSSLPLLLGMSLTFAGVATLAAVGGGWAVAANRYGRAAALLLLAFFALTLLFPVLSEHLTRPLVALGARLSRSAAGTPGEPGGFGPSFLLGIATGLLWAPCAGPILGLILTGAALNGASARTSLLLLAYAAGAATSLGLALRVGGRVFAAMKRSLGAGEWIRRGLGLAMLAGVAAIALGLDTGLLTRLSQAKTADLEQRLIDRVAPAAPAPSSANADEATLPETLPIERPLPSLKGATEWLNSKPLTEGGLRGKVVLVDFWTYSCINCLRSLPYVKAWAERYKDEGLVVIGVHAPEFAFEKDLGNVRRAVKELGLSYPIAVDNEFALWRAFGNQYWPAHYFVDAKGNVRHHHFGEGEYETSEKVIRQLLAEASGKQISGATVRADGAGPQLPARFADIQSPETYLGHRRAKAFASPGGLVADRMHRYTRPATLELNQWGLSGEWRVDAESATAPRAKGRIVYRFHARDLHLVLGAESPDRPVRFRVLLDGRAPGADHGVDIDASGQGVIRGQRLYQLIRQQGPVTDRTFELELEDPGAQAFAFTFG